MRRPSAAARAVVAVSFPSGSETSTSPWPTTPGPSTLAAWSKPTRASWSLGSWPRTPLRMSSVNAGSASATRSSPLSATARTGRRVTRSVHELQNEADRPGLTAKPRSRPGSQARRPSRRNSGSSRVVEANTDTATTRIAPSASERSAELSTVQIAASDAITAAPEKTTARPEVASARPRAVAGSWPARISSR